MASRFSAARAFVENKANQAREMNSVDALVKEAQLQELGFNVQKKPAVMGGLFGGGYGGVTRDPNFVGTAQLERQKLQGELEDQEIVRGLRKRFGQGASAGDSKSAMIFEPISGKMVKNPAYVTPYQEFRMGQGGGLTPGRQLAKDKATTEIFGMVEGNKVKRKTLDNALAGAENVPQGLFGKMRMGVARALPAVRGAVGVNEKQLQDAQELKMALTDATLAQTAHTKGAISDAEMFLFREASANNDFNSPGIQPVLQKLRDFIEADEAGAMGAYQKNYGENPREWFGAGAQQQSGQDPLRSTFDEVPDGLYGKEKDFYLMAVQNNYTPEQAMQEIEKRRRG